MKIKPNFIKKICRKEIKKILKSEYDEETKYSFDEIESVIDNITELMNDKYDDVDKNQIIDGLQKYICIQNDQYYFNLTAKNTEKIDFLDKYRTTESSHNET